MIVKKIFELPMLSSLLNHEPELLIKGLDISMILDGKDLSDANRHVCLSFKNYVRKEIHFRKLECIRKRCLVLSMLWR